MYTTSPVPQISIDFAPIPEPAIEPVSPFDSFVFAKQEEEDSLRSIHLLPPPVMSPRAAATKTQQSYSGKGLEKSHFELLLQASRERRASAPKPLELRKEVALKAHASKQLERRALFLSKIDALPSPTATSTPVTPPESPAVFHFSLPSPGLVSPLALFETLETSSGRNVRVEEVDFRARAHKDAEATARITKNVKQSFAINGLASPRQTSPKTSRNLPPVNKGLPTLDEISARMNGASLARQRSPSPPNKPRAAIPLPAFLQRPAVQSRPMTVVPVTPTTPRICVSPPPAAPAAPAPTPSQRSSLTEANLRSLERRQEQGKFMVEKLKRRVSAPAELIARGDSHPILRRPGAF